LPLLGTTTIEALHTASYVFATLAVTSCLYFVLSAVASLKARTALRAKTPERPPLSLLMPLCGKEPRLRDNLESALRALHPGDELVVGAADANDPAIEVARTLSDPRLRVVAGSSSRATNRKVATLVALELHATKEMIVLADSDVRLDPTVLDRLAGSAGHGMATALYRGIPSGSLASRIEALAINTDFMPSVLVASLLAGGIEFGLGAANALRRDALQAIGGFASLGEVLADDHQLGRKVKAAGFPVTIAPVCVAIVQDSSTGATLSRLLRWCRTYRVCQPVGYAATVFSHHGIAASLVATALAPALWPIAAGTVALRVVTALVAHAAVAGREADFASLPLLPVRDLVGTALFVLAWTGRTVTWRGRRFRVAADGTLTALGTAEPFAQPQPTLLAAPGGRSS
jgi:ceramide glucosyltransferase